MFTLLILLVILFTNLNLNKWLIILVFKKMNLALQLKNNH